MQFTFDSSRIFNDQDGWYIVMRKSDDIYLAGYKHKLIGEQHLMGPFESRHQTENWFEGYLAIYSKNRDSDSFMPDSIQSYH